MGLLGLLLEAVIDLAYLALSPLLLAFLLVASRGFTRPKYRRGLLAKLGGIEPRGGVGPCLWVHAVSVGEVMTAAPLVRAFREARPTWDVRLSVSTFTGLEVARKHLPEVPVFYFPLDLSPVVRRFFRRLRPTAVVLVELELWPNFLIEARRRGVPVLVANGRITERSARRYALAGRATRGLFGLVGSFGAQSEEYRARFAALGVDPAKLEVLGNLKHDREPPPVAGRAQEIRRLLGWPEGETVVITAGSTHPGEEALLLSLHGGLMRHDPRVRLVIAPRHVERLDPAEVARWGAAERIVRWSRVRGTALEDAGRDVLLVDTLGELELFYSMADLVFVGGSMVPRGGHNLFEAARLGKAVVFGPSYGNFREEGDLLLAEGAAVRVEDPASLEREIARLVADERVRRDLGKKAAAAALSLRGATRRHLAWLERQLQLPLNDSPG